MARKTKEDAEATRAGILDAAELCFLQKGVARTTLEDIAARAGHTRGAVYWHFKNKQEVFEAVMDRVGSPIFRELELIASPTNPAPLEALRQFLRTAFEDLVHNPHARNAVEITLLHCELVEETRPILSRDQRRGSQFVAHVTETLAQAQRLKQMRADLEPARCAMILHCWSMGLLREWLLDPGALSLQRDGLAMLDVLLDSFSAPAAEGSKALRRPRIARVGR